MLNNTEKSSIEALHYYKITVKFMLKISFTVVLQYCKDSIELLSEVSSLIYNLIVT